MVGPTTNGYFVKCVTGVVDGINANSVERYERLDVSGQPFVSFPDASILRLSNAPAGEWYLASLIIEYCRSSGPLSLCCHRSTSTYYWDVYPIPGWLLLNTQLPSSFELSSFIIVRAIIGDTFLFFFFYLFIHWGIRVFFQIFRTAKF